MHKDEKSHGHHDLDIIVGVIRKSVDDIVEEKLVRTIHHDM
jgi:hypothetical protein